MQKSTPYVAFAVGALVLVASTVADGNTLWRYTNSSALATLASPRDALLRFDIGNYYFGEGAYDLEKAEAFYYDALKLNPRLQGPHYQLARINFILGDFYVAEQEINKEIALQPDFKRSYYVRGLIHGYTNNLGKAAKDFETFLEWRPNSWAGHNDLAWVYFQQGKFKEARDTTRAGLAYAPDNVWLLNSLGVALLNLGERKEAKAALERAAGVAGTMTAEEWGIAYPGNDPSLYEEGFQKMKASISENLALLSSVDSGEGD